jgi:hypothetical protein
MGENGTSSTARRHGGRLFPCRPASTMLAIPGAVMPYFGILAASCAAAESRFQHPDHAATQPSSRATGRVTRGWLGFQTIEFFRNAAGDFA